MLFEIVFWLVALAIPLAALAWSTWEHDIRAHIVPRAEIEALADRLEREYGAGALAAAEEKEAAAFARGAATEQGVWRRVARTLRRRKGA
ncbi:hypothetical protein [Salinarimonas sp.]|uniref:hypothetical protein n=1 Tax=Salinarimonas sp. TaxID=2766526 RepID=UPI0032D9203D